VVFFLADDMGYGDLASYGNPDIRMPYLDDLAEQGVMLTQHYSGSCMCAPARAAFLTGRYPHRTGAVDVVGVRGLDRIALRETTIADLFKAAGYATGCIGKWHNGSIDPEYHPNARGFDEFVGFRAGMLYSYWDWVIEKDGTYHRSDGRYLTDVFTEEALSFIDRHQKEPFFLYVPYNAPHLPWEAPEEDIEEFRNMGKFTEDVCTIYGMNRRMDAGVGRVLERLQQHGLLNNTIVVFTSDNGPDVMHRDESRRYNCGLNGEKGYTLEGGIRVPAIVRWPDGLPSGRQVDTMTHFNDWLPTLLGAVGQQIPAELNIDGMDIMPLLRDEDDIGAAKQFWQWNRYQPVPHCNAAMREGPWKLYLPPIPEAVFYKLAIDDERTMLLANHPEQVTSLYLQPPVKRELSEPRDPMLFNLEDDPYEQENLAQQYPERLQKMQQELDSWFAEVEAERRSIRG